ncbi:chemotaxis protein CheW [Sphingomonas sp.]|uniref:chemotaxis protein CheW n=1 Tax=Sphingomonas sp. TaxID=28214 RepID=UPI00307CEE8D
MVEIGGLVHAVPLLDIREIAPRPDALVPMPGGQTGAVGAMEMRGALIPVFDTATLLGLDTQDLGALVLVLRLGRGVAGFTVDRVHGVWSITTGQITPFAQADEAVVQSEAIVGGFCHEQGNGFVLDPRALAQRIGFRIAADRRAESVEVKRGDPAIQFSAGPVKLVIEARAVVAMAPSTAIDPSPVNGSMWTGFIQHVGQRVPIIDTLQLLGLGAYPTAAHAASIIIRLANGATLAMRLDKVDDLVRLGEGAVGPMGAFGGLRRDLFSGLYTGDGQSLVLNASALQADPQLIEIGKLAAQNEQRDGAVGHAQREPFLRFTLNHRLFAVALAQVDELIRVPPTLLGGAHDGEVVKGLISHRGRAIPLIDIRRSVGIAEGGPGTFGIVISVMDDHVAIAADTLVSVERLGVRSLAPKPTTDEPDLFATTIVSDGAACPVLDLSALASRVLAHDAGSTYVVEAIA